MFYGVENKENMIAGVIGYDSIRKHLAVCGYHTAEIREKYHPYGCVHRKLEDMPDECTFRINGAPFPRQRCKRLAPAVRYPFVVTC